MSSAARTAVITGALVTPLVVATAPLSYADPAGKPARAGHGSAYGITANGLVNLPATPSVSSSDARPARKTLAELPENSLVKASALESVAEARKGRASVSNLDIAKALLQAETVTARCENGKGYANLAGARLNGRPLAVNPAPNSALRVPIEGYGEAALTLNRQRRTPKGGLTVSAIELDLPRTEGGKSQRIIVASATCAVKERYHSHKPKHRDYERPPARPEKPAPAPTPVPRDLPVTG